MGHNGYNGAKEVARVDGFMSNAGMQNFSEPSVPEAEQLAAASREVSKLDLATLEGLAAKLIACPHELSWLNKPYEAAVFAELRERTGIINERLLERFFLTTHDTSSLFSLVDRRGALSEENDFRNEHLLSVSPLRVLFLSAKFGNYVSSQEYFFEVLRGVSASLEFTLLSDRGFSEKYTQHFRCEKFSSPEDFFQILGKVGPALIVDLSGSYSHLLRNVAPPHFVVDPHGAPQVGADHLYSQLATGSFRKFKRFLKRPIWVAEDPLMFIPPPSEVRQYAEIKRAATQGGPIIFGAFCRTMKLSMPVVREWAAILRRHANSQLWFAFIQSNPQSEAIARKIFAGLGVSSDRVRFLPRMHARDYLSGLNEVTINLGAMPEQGGISCMDSLLMGCPYVVCDELSNTFVSALALEELSLREWVAPTIEGYHAMIDGLLGDRVKLSDVGVRQEIRNRLLCSPLGSAARTANEWLRFFESLVRPS
jgi:hypothetical protein